MGTMSSHYSSNIEGPQQSSQSNQISYGDPSIMSTHYSSNIRHTNEKSQQSNQYFQSKKIEKSVHMLNEPCNNQQSNQHFQSKKIEKSPQMVNEAHNNQIFHEDPTIMSTQYSLNISHRNEESQQSNQFNQIPY